MNQLGFCEPSYVSDRFEHDGIRSQKLIEFGNQAMVFYAIALNQCFGFGVNQCEADNVRKFRETLSCKTIPES